MSAFRIDGALTTAQTMGGARKSFPFEGDVSSFIVEQDYHVLLTSYSPLALSTAHGTYTNAYLVRESGLENLGAGVVKFTRTYAQIPATRDEYGTFSFQFPGLLGAQTPPYNQYWVSADDGRDPFNAVSISRIRSEYFLCETGQTYETPSEIDIYPAIFYTLDGNPDARIEYLLADAISYWSASDPSKEEWLALIAGGAGIGTGSEAGEFIGQDSTIERWQGEIYVRKTTYVVAK